MGSAFAIFNRTFLTRMLLLCALLAAGTHVLNSSTGGLMGATSPQVTKHYAFGMAHLASPAARGQGANKSRYAAHQLGVQQSGPIATAIEDLSALIAESPAGYLFIAVVLCVVLVRYRTRERPKVTSAVSDGGETSIWRVLRIWPVRD